MNIDTVRDAWTDRAGEYSPTYYAHRGPNETSERIREALTAHLDREAAVLELGCGSGRHLGHLAAHGFDDLSGVDINADAFDVMREAYPDLAADGTFYYGAIENLVGEFGDGAFDAVYSVETLQHLHPDVDRVFEEIARITDEVLVTAEIEEPAGETEATDPDVNYVDDETPLYYRDWGEVFTSLGLVEVDAVRGDRDTARTFRVTD
ncbi:class I SAM-dependent methyltransferase [Halorubrum tropicale]|uniref:Methyltransferase type 11 n=1 Tax=Halorubrum tropicale TaxID=1765655 RepID=A0A0N0BRR5_9EURY|nr:class I SAM-dependent methyltransferase [Halorubrum tropicale]KOX97220.1 methyltransferase type 11 [Halorubrum tropicale]